MAGWQNAPMSARQRLIAISVAVLVVVGIGVVAVSLPDGVGGEPLPSASADPTASATAVMPGPSGSVAPDDELLAKLREIEAEVVAIRGLPPADIGPPDLISRAELIEELETLFDDDYPAEEREQDNLALRALGLIGPDDDVAELQLQLLSEQVVGFYDDEERRMVVVVEGEFDAEAQVYYAHEYAHALQDAAFGLDSLGTDAEGEDDRSLARTSLIEGDASVTMLAWAFANLTPEELIGIATPTQVPDMTGIPSWMAAQLQYPYTDGLEWAGALVGNPIAAPDFDPIDDAFGTPPDSTEQIDDLAKWDPREDPIDVDVVDLAASLGEGWSPVETTTLGQAMIGFMLEYHGLGITGAREAGRGWGGDRVVVAYGPDEAFAVAWRLAWDTQADAAEFATAYRGILETLPFAADVVELANDEVLVVHASSDDLLERTIDAAD
jgi:hypothetical protein